MSFSPADQYHEKRSPTDFNLVEFVRGLLLKNNVSQAQLDAFNNNQHVVMAADRKPEVQRYHMNQYWNLQLLKAERVSVDERYSLIPNGSIEDWCRLFERGVLPFVLSNNLPRV